MKRKILKIFKKGNTSAIDDDAVTTTTGIKLLITFVAKQWEGVFWKVFKKVVPFCTFRDFINQKIEYYLNLSEFDGGVAVW